MVWHGPSRGCLTCIQRKIKCDEGRPTCQKCSKSKRICGGYRQATGALVIRYEGAPAKKPPKSLSSPDEFHDYPSAVCSADARKIMRAARRLANGIPPGLVMPAPEWAMRYWVESMMYKFPRSYHVIYGGIITCVQDLFSHCSTSPALHAALSAVALGTLSRQCRDEYISSKAIASHGMALTGIQKAVSSPETIKSDETLLAILLLSLYETLICLDRSPLAWASHVRGAATVIRLRGQAQLERDRGIKLFKAFHDQFLYSGIAQLGLEHEMPKVLELCNTFQGIREDIPINRLRGVGNEAIRLQTQLRELELKKLEADPQMIRKVASAINTIDEELGEWTETVPGEWYGSIMPLEAETLASDDFGTDHAFAYASIWIATFWVSYRTLRIFCCNLLERCARLHRTVDPTADDLVFAGTPSAIDLAEDICASVPYFLGYTAAKGERKFSSLEQLGERPPPILCAYQLMWPLYIAGRVDGVSLDRRRWIARKLVYIGNDIGIRQAIALSEQLGVSPMDSKEIPALLRPCNTLTV